MLINLVWIVGAMGIPLLNVIYKTRSEREVLLKGDLASLANQRIASIEPSPPPRLAFYKISGRLFLARFMAFLEGPYVVLLAERSASVAEHPGIYYSLGSGTQQTCRFPAPWMSPLL